jgi:hypothetical protein
MMRSRRWIGKSWPKSPFRIFGTMVPAAEQNAAADGQAEADAEITDHQSPSQAAEAPRRAAEVAIQKLLARRGFEDAERVRRLMKASAHWHDEQPNSA